MSNRFNQKEYLNFLKLAYKDSYIIYAYFDEVIKDVSLLQNGKFSYIADNIIGKEIEYDPISGIPHSRLQIKKGYPVYHFLELISGWDEFSGMDPVTEVSLWEVDFYYDNKCVVVIVSDYRAYDNAFYLYDE